MVEHKRIMIDKLDDGWLVTVIDKDGERDVAAESRLAVIYRLLCWLDFARDEGFAIMDAVRGALMGTGTERLQAIEEAARAVWKRYHIPGLRSGGRPYWEVLGKALGDKSDYSFDPDRYPVECGCCGEDNI